MKLYHLDLSGCLFYKVYIYFYLNEKTKESNFICLYIKPEYHGMGLAFLLVAYWLQFCMPYDYYNFSEEETVSKIYDNLMNAELVEKIEIYESGIIFDSSNRKRLLRILEKLEK